jgi:hypothetical protein
VNTPFATVKAADGVVVKFFALRDENGRVQSIMVGQAHNARTAGLSEIEGLRDATPLDMFQAISKPGAKVPAVLSKLYGAPTRDDQGWARGELVADPNPTGGGNHNSCMPGAQAFGSFDNEILDKGYAGLFLSEKDGPYTKPSHWSGLGGPADGTDWYNLTGQARGAKAFYAKVQYCFKDINIYGNFEPDPVASAYVRIAGFGAYQQMEVATLSEPGDEMEYFSFPQTGSNYDYRLEIDQVRLLDLFHIGATWSKPGSYIKP